MLKSLLVPIVKHTMHVIVFMFYKQGDSNCIQVMKNSNVIKLNIIQLTFKNRNKAHKGLYKTTRMNFDLEQRLILYI